ncbi:MAG: hypothetical protein LN413_05635 [Candidatus Thermoplasmatota archaeon]|nr:hypothetical protein [Candidatus Thermoplasmatota archaeon]
MRREVRPDLCPGRAPIGGLAELLVVRHHEGVPTRKDRDLVGVNLTLP